MIETVMVLKSRKYLLAVAAAWAGAAFVMLAFLRPCDASEVDNAGES